MSTITEYRRATFALECAVRDVRAADLPVLEWYGTHSHLRQMEGTYLRDVQNGAKLWLVVESRAFPIGHLKVNLRVEDPLRGNPRGYLFALRVFEPFQRMGIGTLLVKTAESSLRVRGFRFASIAVGKDNPGARKLYERLGYRVYREEIGRWHYVDADGRTHRVEEPEFLMEKPL